MSVISEPQTVENDVKGFFTKYVSDYRKAKALWNVLRDPQTRAILLKVGTDAIKLGKDADAAAKAGGFSLLVGADVVADIQQLIADAKAGDPIITADLAILGVTL